MRSNRKLWPLAISHWPLAFNFQLTTLYNVYPFNQFINQNLKIMSIVLYLLLGAVAGWLAGVLMKGGGFGLLWNIIIGIIGGFIGGWLMSLLHIQKAGLLWELIVAVIGAVVLLFVISLFKKK